ncbi:MAG: hypothetical protein RL414_460 [Actinomycetota bacterium]|jgi:ABC-type glycerol-3-phosphate transport system permease component
MESLAYLVAFMLAMIVIGGPAALALTYLRPYRRSSKIALALLALLLALISLLIGAVFLLSEGALVSKALGLVGTGTGIAAGVRAFRQLRASL